MALTQDLIAAEDTQVITLTERAASELRTMIAENAKQGAALRVWVAGGGCSGLSYGMALDDAAPEEGDLVLNQQDINIYVDELSVKYMVGSVVDYVDDVLGGGFKIENPKAVKSCGCGSSFSTGEEGIEGLDTRAGGGCGGCGSH